MSISTVADLIKIALKTAGVLGVGQTPLAEDTNDAMTYLTAMIGQWNRKRWLVPNETDWYFQATGAVSYQAGPGDFNTDFSGSFSTGTYRFPKIAAAFARLSPGTNGQPSSSSVDYPLEIIRAREDWSNYITVKGIGSFPKYVFYDSAYPIGNVYFWPIPSSQYEMHVIIWGNLPTYLNLTDSLNVPPEYQEALIYNLAARLRASYQLPPDPFIVQMATDSLAVIKGVNTQVPRLGMPSGVAGKGGRYNIYSDTTN